MPIKINNERDLIASLRSVDAPTLGIELIVFLSAALLLVLKGATNTLSFILSFSCIWLLISRAHGGAKWRIVGNVWPVIACLCAPLSTTILSQLGQLSFKVSDFDGPSRLLLFIPVYLYMLRLDRDRLINALAFGSLVGVTLVFCSLVMFPEQYWGYRAATYFIDPITLPVYVVALMGIFIFADPVRKNPTIKYVLNTSLLLMTSFVILESQSRTSWLAFVGLIVVWIFYKRPSNWIQICMMPLLLITVGIVSYKLSDVIQVRISDVISVLSIFAEGSSEEFHTVVQNSAIGHRIVSFFIDLRLLHDNFWFGTLDKDMPPYDELALKIPLLNEEIYNIKRLSGSHSEFLSQMVQKGAIFGGLSLVFYFIYPSYIILKGIRREIDANTSKSAGFLGFIVTLFLSSLTIQVFNLKVTATFFGLCLVIFLSSVYTMPKKQSADLFDQ